MNARMRRLMSDWELIQKDFQGHRNIVVEPIEGDPPEKYRVTYYVNGIYLLPDGRIQVLNKHIVEITLHAEYPRYKPICRIYTPIWHPNFRNGQICIGDIWGAGESLSDIIVNIGDMIQYKSWNSFSPLSADAAQWAIQNKQLFPVGNINLWMAEDDDINKEVEIDLFHEGDESGFHKEVPPDGAAENEDDKKITLESNYEEAFSDAAASNSAANVEEYTFTPGISDVKTDSGTNDFEITAEELAGVKFVTSAQRMQNIKYNNVQRAIGGRVNFRTVFMKGILYGLIGGIVAWLLNELINPDTEKVLSWMGYTMSELVSKVNQEILSETDALHIIGNATRLGTALFSSILGGTIGAFMGLGEGLYYGSKGKAVKYTLIGLGVSFCISFIGGYAAQILFSTMLHNVTEATSISYISFARSIAWALMGLGVGVSVGLIKPQMRRIVNCSLGGLIGGFLGGLVFDYIYLAIGNEDSSVVPRAVGIILMATLIGLGIGLLEQFAKAAWLKVVRGEFEGKEYLVFTGQTTIGNSGKNSIALFKDKLVAPYHCEIALEGNKYVLIDKGAPIGTFVNGMRVYRHILRQDDAIAMGNSVLVFNTK